MRCDKKKETAFYKKTAHRTQIKMLTSNPTLCAQKKNLSSAKSSPIAGLYVAFTMRKSAASRCFRHLIELCAPLIMNAAPRTALLISSPAQKDHAGNRLSLTV